MKKIALILVFVGVLFSCSEEKEDLNSIPEADFEYSDEIDEIKLIDNSSDADSDPLTYTWATESDLIRLSNTSSSSTYFLLTESNDDQEVDISLTISDAESESSITKTITVPKLTQSRIYGLGAELTKEKSNNVSYNWYFDQANTGVHSNVNCGPTSVTMAISWAKENFTETPEDARSVFHSSGGWWHTNNIIDYLNMKNVSNYTVNLTDISKVKTELDAGNIAILCLDMYYISAQKKNTWHVDKFYTANTDGWGHFIVVKGYKNVDGKFFYEVYDPYGYGKKYNDGSFKGVDRYYRAEDLNKATNLWWDYAIIITKNKNNITKGVDVNKIEHMSGR